MGHNETKALLPCSGIPNLTHLDPGSTFSKAKYANKIGERMVSCKCTARERGPSASRPAFEREAREGQLPVNEVLALAVYARKQCLQPRRLRAARVRRDKAYWVRICNTGMHTSEYRNHVKVSSDAASESMEVTTQLFSHREVTTQLFSHRR